MARNRMADQLAFNFFDEPVRATPAIPAIQPDRVKEAIIGAKLEHNEFLLKLNQQLTSRIECPYPSRMYRFPVEFVDRERFRGEESKVLLMHPLIGGSEFVAPFLEEIERSTGIKPLWEAQDEFGRDRGERFRYFHAIDLCTNEHWQHLMETLQYTDPKAVFRAVMFGLEYCQLSTANARKIMREMEADENENRSQSLILGDGMWPGQCQQGIAPNFKISGAESAWTVIHAIEDGYVKKKGHFMMVTPTTMNARELARTAA